MRGLGQYATEKQDSQKLFRYDILMTPTMCTLPHKLGEVSMMRTDTEEYRNIVGQ
jgi:hypothetical protein